MSEFASTEIPSLTFEGLLPVFLFIRTPFSLQSDGFVQLILTDAGEEELVTVRLAGLSGAELAQESESEVEVDVEV